MSKSISKEEVYLKIGFLNIFLDEKWVFVLEEDSNALFPFSLWQDYGLEGSDCILVGDLRKINTYLNYVIRKFCLKEDWLDYKKNN